jgi:hypothetical protein
MVPGARLRARRFATVFLAGGLVGEVVTLVAIPVVVATGASQGIVALSAATIVLRRELSVRLAWFAAVIIILSFALDVAFARTIKAGHVASALAGGWLVWSARARSGSSP